MPQLHPRAAELVCGDGVSFLKLSGESDISHGECHGLSSWTGSEHQGLCSLRDGTILLL
jgi:hypothetical protein